MGITVTRDGYRTILDDIGADLIGRVRQNIAAGHEPRIIFDNLDFKILVNIILTNHRNSDHHWIAHFLTFDRVSSQNLYDSLNSLSSEGILRSLDHATLKNHISAVISSTL